MYYHFFLLNYFVKGVVIVVGNKDKSVVGTDNAFSIPFSAFAVYIHLFSFHFITVCHLFKSMPAFLFIGLCNNFKTKSAAAGRCHQVNKSDVILRNASDEESRGMMSLAVISQSDITERSFASLRMTKSCYG